MSGQSTRIIEATYDAVHPRWQDRLILLADGTYRRASNGDPGNYTFDGAALTLHWTHWGPEVLAADPGGGFRNDAGFSLALVPPEIPLSGLYAAVTRDGWRDQITLAADGTFTTGGGFGGRYAFDGARLDLHWNNASIWYLWSNGLGGYVHPQDGFSLGPSYQAPFPSIIGAYTGTHPHWRDSVELKSDFSFQRSNGDGGRWGFDGANLALHWTEWGSEVLAVTPDGRFVREAFTLTPRFPVPDRTIAVEYNGHFGRWNGQAYLWTSGKVTCVYGDEGRFAFDGQTLTIDWSRGGSESLPLARPGVFGVEGGSYLQARQSPPALSVVGAWECTLPGRGGMVSLGPDYTVARMYGDSGQYWFDGVKLMIQWKRGVTETLLRADMNKLVNEAGDAGLTRR